MTGHRLLLASLVLAGGCAGGGAAAPGADKRVEKLRRIYRAQDPAKLGALRAALAAGSPAERVEAAFGLGQLGVAELPDGGDEPEPLKQARAGAATELVPAASDPDVELRRAAVEALGKVGGPDDEAALLAASSDVDASVRGEAALALFRVRFLKRAPEFSTASVRALVRLAADPEPEVRWRAVYAFTRFPDARARAALESAQRDADWRARLFAARALGKLGQAPDSALLDDADEKVRAEAAAAYGAAKAGDKLRLGTLADPAPRVRAAAVDSLAAGPASPVATLALVDVLRTDTSPLVKGQVLLALAKRGEIAALSGPLKDSNWWVRSRAYLALGAAAASAGAESSGMLEKLRMGIGDSDARVASAALEAFVGLSTSVAKAEHVFGELDRALRDPKSPLEVRGTAVDAAGERADPELIDALLASMPHATGPGAAELRGGIRKALLATAAKAPERKKEIDEALAEFPRFLDKPARYPALAADPTLVLDTQRGRFEVTLDSRGAPNHAAAIADAARRGLYDGTTWHRIVSNFVVQGGDPRGSGWGDCGFRLAEEATRRRFDRGTLGMPKAGPDTGGCQLFVSLVPTPHLDGRYAAFGEVTLGLDVLDKLEPGDVITKAAIR